ncbi:MAG: hypothetical protein WAM04_00775 [Candidatus Sulfotelmatobacter sp.]
MSSTAACDPTKYERLRYVTENFQSLQGLTWVAFGGFLALSDAENVPGIVFPWWLKLLMVLLSIGLVLAAVRYLPKYYERRFGSVEWRVGPPNAKFPIFVLAIVIIFLIILFFGPSVGRYLDSVVSELNDVAHRMISDPDHRANLPPVLYWFALLCAEASNRSHFVRLRMILLSACFLILWTGVSVFLPLRHPDVTQQTLWRILNACWFGVSVMLWGLYHHFMLVHLLPARGQTKDNE